MNRAHVKLLAQAVILGVLALVVIFVVNITAENLERVGITTGLGFLNDPSGFEVAFSMIDHSASHTHLNVFWVGIVNTLLASVIAISLSTLIGLVVGVAQLSSNKITAAISRTYVEAFRNIPLLLIIFFWYFITITIFPHVAESYSLGEFAFLNRRGLFLPSVDMDTITFIVVILLFSIPFLSPYFLSKSRFGHTFSRTKIFLTSLLTTIVLIGLLFISGLLNATVEMPIAGRFNISGGFEIIPEFFALIVGLSIYHGAFVAENVRGGILAVPKGQSEAALSTGLSNWQTMRYVIIPQALRIIIPPYISITLNIVKNTSLGAAIAFPELMNVFAGTSLNQTGNAIEIILMVMLFYFVVSMVLSIILNIYNRRIQIVER